MKSENQKLIKPQIMLSSNIDQELSKIDSNLNKHVTRGSNHSLGIFILANFSTLTKVNLIITDIAGRFEAEESTE
jgi:hypothetical protein